MRFCLFGQGEGVRAECDAPEWACERDGIIRDASISARKRGIRPGMDTTSAQGLLPSLILCPEEPDPTSTMQTVWETLWNSSPWLETVNHDGFLLQIPSKQPPMRETRSLLETLDSRLSSEQRFRVGLAENPFLARALVEWSHVERVPGAMYRKVNRQLLVVSPAVAAWVRAESADMPMRMGDWIRQFPTRALWPLPIAIRQALIELGVTRLDDLTRVPISLLQAHFGKEALLWIRSLQQQPGGQIQVNYPPLAHRECWYAPVGDEVPTSRAPEIVAQLVDVLSLELTRVGAGALKVGMRWVTEEADASFERILKRPIAESHVLQTQLAPGFERISGVELSALEVYVEDMRPLAAVQMSFQIHRDMLVPSEAVTRGELRAVLNQIHRKFPHRLQQGARPGFRELRLQAILGDP